VVNVRGTSKIFVGINLGWPGGGGAVGGVLVLCKRGENFEGGGGGLGWGVWGGGGGGGLPKFPKECYSSITDLVQLQPEDGPHIGPKHVVVRTLIVIIGANIVVFD